MPEYLNDIYTDRDFDDKDSILYGFGSKMSDASSVGPQSIGRERDLSDCNTGTLPLSKLSFEGSLNENGTKRWKERLKENLRNARKEIYKETDRFFGEIISGDYNAIPVYSGQVKASPSTAETWFFFGGPLRLRLDNETEDMCRRNKILPYIETIRDAIYKTYESVKDIKVQLAENLSYSHNQIDFEIHVTGGPAKILEDEERFYSLFFQKVPENKQKFFVFTYRVYDYEAS